VDGDGHGDAACQGADNESLGADCDDADPLRFPGNTEICDSDDRDEDCDPQTIGFRDTDNDGYIDALCCNHQDDGDLECGEDCDDNRGSVSPSATETCDLLDNNCDGEVDEGVAIQRYPDQDHDGHGDSGKKAVATCPQSVGFGSTNDDCDDEDPEVFTGQFEICDDKDNNCDPEGLADEIEEQAPWFRDQDEDGFGDGTSGPVWSCYRIPGRVLSQNDCKDDDSKVNRNASEACDGKDNDCNGLSDFRLPGVNDFEDDDGDGEPDAACGGGDCDDRNPGAGENAEETCDHADNDCDGQVDEETTQTIWYIDEDGDGWGVVVGSALASCDPLPGRSRQFGDCNDEDVATHPGLTELCDGQDNDCNGDVDEGATAYCELPNAISTCQSGHCAIYACQAGFVNADDDEGNGCEAPFVLGPPLNAEPCTTQSDCNDGDLCNGIETCQAGSCRASTPILCTSSETVVEGDVTIEGGADIRRLRNVERITGNLTISGTTLRSLVGLESLRWIGKSLMVYSNPWLERLSGSALSNLEVVGGTIYIDGNQRLVSADLPSLVSAKGISISGNSSLTELTGYRALAIVDQLRITNNPITQLTAFGALTRVGGSSGQYCGEGGCQPYPCSGGGIVFDGFGLVEVSGLAKVREIGGDLCVSGFGSERLELPALVRVGEALVIRASYQEGPVPDVLKEISFPQLERAGSLQLELSGPGFGKLEELKFPVLTALSTSLGLTLFDGAFTELSFPRLTQVETLSAIMDGLNTHLERLAFPKLQRAGRLEIFTSGELARPLELLDLSSLSSVDMSLSIQVPVASARGAGLLLGKLGVLGTGDENQDSKPDNNGSLSLCTGVLDSETGAYAGSSCGLVTAFQEKGFVGSVDTCNECSEQPIPVAANPWTGDFEQTVEGSSLAIDCAGNFGRKDSLIADCGEDEAKGIVDVEGNFTASYPCRGETVQLRGRLTRVSEAVIHYYEEQWDETYQQWQQMSDVDFDLVQTPDCTDVQVWQGTTSCAVQDEACETATDMPRTVHMALSSYEGIYSAPTFFVGMNSAMSGDGEQIRIDLPRLYGSASCILETQAFSETTAHLSCSESTEFDNFDFTLDLSRSFPPPLTKPEL